MNSCMRMTVRAYFFKERILNSILNNYTVCRTEQTTVAVLYYETYQHLFMSRPIIGTWTICYSPVPRIFPKLDRMHIGLQ